MSAWRVIMTDSESLTGVAPVCEYQDDPAVHGDGEGGAEPLRNWVFDCCPRPHIETWGESSARNLAEVLTGLDAEVA